MPLYKLLSRNQFTAEDWDNLHAHSKYKHPALQSWYLDAVAPHWSLLVKGDFEACMPLMVKSKYGLKYAAKPTLVQQMGCISRKDSCLEEMLKNVPKGIRLIEIPGNDLDQFPANAFPQDNYCLPLDADYESIRKGFNSNTKRNINKAKKNGVTVSELNDPQAIFEFFMSNNSKNGIQPFEEKPIRDLIEAGISSHKQICFVALSEDKNMLGAALFTPALGKHVYSLAASTDEGMNKQAMFAIIDHYIQQHAGQEGEMLDFEGSNIPGIARFYKGFGAENHPYPFIKINRLPWPIKLLKK